MAHEILSVKLCELDEKICRLHSRIHLSESAGKERLEQEISELSAECEETELSLRDELRFSKASAVMPLAKLYAEVEDAAGKLREEQRMGASAEEKTLFAEYALDFAVLVADRAVLASMEAIDSQREQDEHEERTSS